MINRTITIEDVGEYSIFIKTEVPEQADLISISEKGVLDNWHMSKEIVKTEDGIIAYFDKKIDSVFKEGSTHIISFFRTLHLKDMFGNAMNINVELDENLI